RVVLLVQAVHNLGVVVGRSVRALLSSKRDDHPGKVIPMRRQLVLRIFAADFDPSPLSPQIQTGCGLDCFSDVCSAYPRRDLEKVEPTVLTSLDELSVSDSSHQPKLVDQVLVECFECPCVFAVA